MANVISDETMEYVGILAKLELKDEEKESARQDMQKMVDYVDKLNEARHQQGRADDPHFRDGKCIPRG